MSDLPKWGIDEEHSDIKAHVAPKTKCIFVFKTEELHKILKSNGSNYKKRPASQPGVKGWTAYGYLIPWEDIPEIILVTYDKFEWWERFKKEMSTTMKGNRAVKLIKTLMREAKFPLWIDAEEAKTIQIDINGTDLTVDGKWKIQVKCDFDAGPKDKGGTGNLYIQTHERNPLRLY